MAGRERGGRDGDGGPNRGDRLLARHPSPDGAGARMTAASATLVTLPRR